jgi:hypothetical protein
MATTPVRIQPKNRLLAWIEERLPILSFLSSHTSELAGMKLSCSRHQPPTVGSKMMMKAQMTRPKATPHRALTV